MKPSARPFSAADFRLLLPAITVIFILFILSQITSAQQAPAPMPAAPMPAAPLLQRDVPPSPIPPIASEARYDLEYVDVYAEFFPTAYAAEIIADAYLTCNGSDPVILRCEDNFQSMQVSGDQLNLTWRYDKPYFWLYNLGAGTRKVTFRYRVLHHGLATSGAIIATNRLDLNTNSFWYPRNIASDPHQVILNLDTPPGYAVYSNGETIRDIPNNFKELRTILLRKPSAGGLTLRHTP